MFTIQTSPERKLKLCAIPTCVGKRYDLVHKFPMNNERAQQWIDAIDMPELQEMPLDKVRKRFFICSKHFRPQDYKNCESRSLNTTAYPRLHLKAGIEDECNEQSATIVENSTDELQVIEYIMTDGGADLRETADMDQINATPFVKCETKSPIQYVVCSPPQPPLPVPSSTPSTTSVPILLRRNQKKRPETIIDKSPTRIQTIAQKALPIKSVVSQINRSTMGNRVVNIVGQKSLPNKYAPKRNASSGMEPICKKPYLMDEIEHIQMADDIANDTSVDEPAMLTLHHKPLDRSFEVCSFWLRDHCRCTMCYSETAQRKFNVTGIPLDVEPTELKTENNNVSVTWSDGHLSNYNIAHIFDQLHPSDSLYLKPMLWSAADIVGNEYANVSQNDYLCNDDVAKSVVASLVKFGFAFIKNVPPSEESTKTAVRRLFPIQKTHFGKMWSFTDNKARNDSAYTNEALLAHNDSTYFSDAPGLQILHCTNRSDTEGGETLLVDGFQVLKNLRNHNADAYEYLSRTSLPSEYIEDGFHFKHCAPVIILDPVTGEPNQIRFNMNDRAFFNTLPQKKMMQFYKHYTALAKEIQSIENEWRFKLEPGTVCIFDNWRVLHGRTAFKGRRQMVGCYVARCEYLSVARRYGLIS